MRKQRGLDKIGDLRGVKKMYAIVYRKPVNEFKRVFTRSFLRIIGQNMAKLAKIPDFINPWNYCIKSTFPIGGRQEVN